MYEKLKQLLLKDGWIEQECGDICINGECGTNFFKDNKVIYIGFIDCADKELIKDLKGEI